MLGVVGEQPQHHLQAAHGKVTLQILTSDFDACPAEILAWLKSRWREENFHSPVSTFPPGKHQTPAG